MRILIESELFVHFEEDKLCASLFLGPDQSDPYAYHFKLNDLVDHIFQMEEIPDSTKISKSGALEIEKVITHLREVAQRAEDKLSTYTILKEKK